MSQREGCMLSDRDILEALRTGELVISGFKEESLTPNGYDMSVGEIMVPDMGLHVREGTVKIEALHRFLISTGEEIHMPSGMVAQIWIKSRWARRGVLASFGLVDAGFRGTLTLGAFATETVEISVGELFAQICFLRLASPAIGDYSTRSGNYQNQRGIRI